MITCSPELLIGWVGKLIDKEGRCDSALRVDVQLNLQQVLLQGADQVDDQLDDKVLVIFLQGLIGHQQRYIVVLNKTGHTLMGFLRRT